MKDKQIKIQKVAPGDKNGMKGSLQAVPKGPAAEHTSELQGGVKKKVDKRNTEEQHGPHSAEAEDETSALALDENNLDVVFTVDRDLCFTYLNNAGCLILGFTKEEIVGMPFARLLSPDQFVLVQSMFEKKKKGIKLTRYEITVNTKTGIPLQLEIQTQLIKEGDKISGVQGIARDITIRKKAQKILDEKIERLSDLQYGFDKVSCISITDKDGIIKYVNKNFCLHYGYTSEEVIGQTHAIINSGHHPASFWKKFWNTIKRGIVFKAEVCNKSKDGKLHWADTTIVPFLNGNKEPYQYMAIRTDITEYRKLEMELAEKRLSDQKYITEITLAAQEKERQELGKELHDNINQILATVKMYLGLARSKAETSEDLIGMSYSYVNEAIEEIRRLSHSLAAPSLGAINLQEALEGLVSILNMPDAVQVRLINDINGSKMIDEKQELMLYRIVQEQMNNINKYAQAQNVVIHLKPDRKFLNLSITDDGVGFDTSVKPRGIGLKNIQSRVEFYNGTSNLVSAPGKGCRLEVKIPI